VVADALLVALIKESVTAESAARRSAATSLVSRLQARDDNPGAKLHDERDTEEVANAISALIERYEIAH
jgi:hypothetical protein